MSYSTIAVCAVDVHFLNRVTACVATEGYTMAPEPFAKDIIWQVSAHDDIEQSYAYALNTGNPDPGGDETVITDQMILSAVQPLMPAKINPINPPEAQPV
jgi:hypothetical protein